MGGPYNDITLLLGKVLDFLCKGFWGVDLLNGNEVGFGGRNGFEAVFE